MEDDVLFEHKYWTRIKCGMSNISERTTDGEHAGEEKEKNGEEGV
jgi:hypothetical protein